MIHVCVHGHFYQPPRQNPWLEAIHREPTAHPFHDWNERIANECYAPNRAARVLDDRGRIARIVNNYERISFNFGATLLQWMEENDPETYRAILEADARGHERHHGHGPAMAQAYGHVILPLASSRDKRTQVRWGIRDFEARFGRRPQGMWLPETAADLESLDLLAEHDIAFTVLAPSQAAAVRRLDGGQWHEAGGARIDPTRPYRVNLPSGRSLTVFFYHGEVSQEVAFQRLLRDGDAFARRMLEAAGRGDRSAPLAHIATDGETYGHHHRHGEMALAYALERLEGEPGVRITNYAAFLAEHPPSHEARIAEGTSWSCVHGVERWRSDCGCNTGAHPEWTQAWRAPLRQALDGLREELDAVYAEEAPSYFRDPWEARDEAVDLLLDRSEENVGRFLAAHAPTGAGGGPPTGEERVQALRLLELQRQGMLMYTSCGWFFDDLAGIEALQVLKHAGRAIQLTRSVSGRDPEPAFLERLEEARSNIPEEGTGARLYRDRVLPLQVNLDQVGAHYAVTSVLESPPARIRIHCYDAERREERRLESGDFRMVLGRVDVESRLTGATRTLSYAVLHMGDHNLVGGVREARGEASYRELLETLEEAFRRARFLDVVRLLDHHFEASTYSLHSLFPDEQERLVRHILKDTLAEVAGLLDRVYERRAPLMRFVADLGIEQPAPFRAAGEFAVNTRLERLLGSDRPDLEEVRRILADAAHSRIALDREALAFAADGALTRAFRALEAQPRDRGRLRHARELAGIIRDLPVQVDLWDPQNAYFRLLQETYPRVEAEVGDPSAAGWLEDFRALGEKLGMALP